MGRFERDLVHPEDLKRADPEFGRYPNLVRKLRKWKAQEAVMAAAVSVAEAVLAQEEAIAELRALTAQAWDFPTRKERDMARRARTAAHQKAAQRQGDVIRAARAYKAARDGSEAGAAEADEFIGSTTSDDDGGGWSP